MLKVFKSGKSWVRRWSSSRAILVYSLAISITGTDKCVFLGAIYRVYVFDGLLHNGANSPTWG